MQDYNENNHKCSDKNSEEKTFTNPINHGCDFWLQLDDQNKLYTWATESQRTLNEAAQRNARAEQPHATCTFRPTWVQGGETQQAGFFSTRVQYGRMTPTGNWSQYYAQVCNTYQDVRKGSGGIANNPRKVRVEIHKRDEELVYEDGNKYTWPGGWNTGTRYTGTAIRIQASYVTSIAETIAHAAELIGATLGDMDQVRNLMKEIIYETIRFDGLEVHHRHHRNKEAAVVQTLRDSARLVVCGNASGKECAEVERGHYMIYGFQTNNFEAIGFNSKIEFEYAGERYEDHVDKHYIKDYCHRRADQLTESHPLAHPKIEVKAHGAYPAPAFEAVRSHLTKILHAHCEWAGIEEDDLVGDAYYHPVEREPVATHTPTDYKIRLKEYFRSDGLHRTVTGMLFHRQTMAIHDILYCILRESWSLNNSISYDRLKEKTGLAKRTIGRYITELADNQIVSRWQEGSMWVRISDFAKKHIGQLLNDFRTEAEIQAELEQRKREREQAREQSQNGEEQPDKEPTPSEVAKDHAGNGGSMWIPLAETTLTITDLPRHASESGLDERQVAILAS